MGMGVLAFILSNAGALGTRSSHSSSSGEEKWELVRVCLLNTSSLMSRVNAWPGIDSRVKAMRSIPS